MQFVSNTDALILDLRNNHGGNGTMANEILSYFFGDSTYVGRNFNKLENTWTDNYIKNTVEITDGIELKMPVYILTSKGTYSAGEGLAYTLQALRNAVVIGDVTKGGAHLTRTFSLGNGFVGFIPYLRGENVKTKTDWEGVGVIPDIVSEESKSLLAAQNIILEKKLTAATDDNEKRKIKWLINYLSSKNSDLIVDNVQAEKFTGRYAEFEITLNKNDLLFRDVNQPDGQFKKMTAITPVLFQAGNDYQLEFITDEKGIYNSIQIYWEDGWLEIIKRTK